MSEINRTSLTIFWWMLTIIVVFIEKLKIICYNSISFFCLSIRSLCLRSLPYCKYRLLITYFAKVKRQQKHLYIGIKMWNLYYISTIIYFKNRGYYSYWNLANSAINVRWRNTLPGQVFEHNVKSYYAGLYSVVAAVYITQCLVYNKQCYPNSIVLLLEKTCIL